MEIPEKLKLNHFLLTGACQSVAALHVDIAPETIKPLKPVVVALSKMGNEKKSQLLRVIFLSLFYYYQVQVFFVCSSYTSLTEIYSKGIF